MTVCVCGTVRLAIRRVIFKTPAPERRCLTSLRPTSMKLESTNWKLPVFIGVLAIAALLINYLFFTRAADQRESKAQEERQAVAVVAAEQAEEKLALEKKEAEERQQRLAKEAEAKRISDEAEAKAKVEVARKKATEEAAAVQARFLARYLNSGFTRRPDVATIGVAIESEAGTMNPTIANALAQRLKTAEVQLLNSFFKPEFVADRFVGNIFSGDTGIFGRLELSNSLNGVLVGKQTVTYSTNAALENTITANLRLEVMALPVGFTRESQSWNFAANGIGFRPHEARQLAEDRIIEQIAKSTNMVLTPRF